jgi:hypothetical protein
MRNTRLDEGVPVKPYPRQKFQGDTDAPRPVAEPAHVAVGHGRPCRPVKPGASAQIEAQTNKNWGELEALYKDLHSHPEVGFTEVRTAGILSEKLRKLVLR